jgi:hypothetical protein
MNVARDKPMVLNKRLGGVKEAGALLLIANPLTLENGSGDHAGADGSANQRWAVLPEAEALFS